MSLTIAVLRKNAMLDSLLDQLNSGFLRIYSGTRPTNPDTALSGNTLLAELTFGATAFSAASGGVKTANAITADSSANNTGTATFFRAFKSDGTTAIIDGSVGTAGTDAIINSTSIAATSTVTCTAMSVTG